MDRRTEKTMIDIFRRRGILSYQSSDEVGLSKLCDHDYEEKLSEDYIDCITISDYSKLANCISDYTRYKDSDKYSPSIHSIMEDHIIYNTYYDTKGNEFAIELVPNVPFDYFVEVYIK